MKGFVAFAFFLLLSFPMIVLVPDLIVYGTLNYKANAVVSQITKEAEMMGGITTPVQTQANELLDQYGLDDLGVELSYSTTGEIAHKGRFTVELTGDYTFKSFNFLGTGIGEFTLAFDASDSGINEVWVR